MALPSRSGSSPSGVRDFIGEYPEEGRPWAQEALGGTTPEVVGGTDCTTPFAGAVGFGSPLSLPYALDIAVPALRSAVGGTQAGE